MNKHVIYIPHLGKEDLLSQQLAYAFAKHHCEHNNHNNHNNYNNHNNSAISNTNSYSDVTTTVSTTTMIVQYGSDLKPLKLITPNDVLQIMFTPIQNLHAPLHSQTSAEGLLNQVPMLIKHLLQDGLNPDGCTIQLYTLEHSDQNADVVKEIAKSLLNITNTKNLSIEWHIIPRLTNLSHEQLHRIFEPKITCHGIIHAIPLKNGDVKLIETNGIYAGWGEVH